jgi:hypothetical protein
MGKVVSILPNHIETIPTGVEDVSVSEGVVLGELASSGSETVAVQVTRLEAGTGVDLCSFGLPLPEGTLIYPDKSQVKVVINGVEQAIYVDHFSGRHSDGTSVRSVGIQFYIDCDYGSPLTGTIYVGDGVTRSTTDIAGTSISWKKPLITCLPTAASYILRCDLLFGQYPIAVADVPASPTWLQTYEDKFVEWGDKHWADDGSAQTASVPGYPDPWDIYYNYYDRALIWFVWWARTGTYKYWYRGVLQAEAFLEWLENQVPDYNPAPRDTAMGGMLIHYMLTGYELGTYAIQQVADRHRYFHHASPKTSAGSDSRIQARTLESYIAAYLIGDTLRDWVTLAGEQITVMLNGQEPNGSYYGYVSWWDSYIGGVFDTAAQWNDLGGNVWRKNIGYKTIDDPNTSILFNGSTYGVPDTTPDADYDYYYHDPYMDIYAESNPEGYYTRMQNSSNRHSCYQTGMMHFAYWLYYNYIAEDSRIIPAIQDAVDFEIANGWVAVNKAFKYIIPITSAGSVDLAGLSIFAMGWLYQEGLGITYRNHGDDLMQAILTAYYWGSKHFNQMHRESSTYQAWR